MKPIPVSSWACPRKPGSGQSQRVLRGRRGGQQGRVPAVFLKPQQLRGPQPLSLAVARGRPGEPAAKSRALRRAQRRRAAEAPVRTEPGSRRKRSRRPFRSLSPGSAPPAWPGSFPPVLAAGCRPCVQTPGPRATPGPQTRACSGDPDVTPLPAGTRCLREPRGPGFQPAARALGALRPPGAGTASAGRARAAGLRLAAETRCSHRLRQREGNSSRSRERAPQKRRKKEGTCPLPAGL